VKANSTTSQPIPANFKILYEGRCVSVQKIELKLALVKNSPRLLANKEKPSFAGCSRPPSAEQNDEMEPLYKWDKWIDDGGGFLAPPQREYRFTFVPFDDRAVLEKNRFDRSAKRKFKTVDDPKIMESFLDEIINYVSTKIRPLSAMSGSSEHKENLLTTKGAGFV